ncbi:hypothetical protein [Phenylobacterium sp.]|uniref:hypothetical protein n=1 Tax=Phenylobacterium sp. TaxID=1871053 RepID=UPI002E340A10|nr:hypothetical protein [Phenylobacterium sp.]HEX4709961.1 hypothetical protein [Phenylobacterium sp.]
MQFVRFDEEQLGWALVDEDEGVLRHVAGEMTAWGPRIAGGEGVWALPLTGRVRPAAQPLLNLRPLLSRILQFPGARPPPAPRLAAVVGTSLAGRRNPFRSIFGYVLLDGEHGCRTVVTRDEFGDQPPGLSASSGYPASLVERLQALDRACGLRPADLVVLGKAEVDDHLHARLMAANLAASRRREKRRAARTAPRPGELGDPGLSYPGQASVNRLAGPTIEA